jgi:hypothetical protein
MSIFGIGSNTAAAVAPQGQPQQATLATGGGIAAQISQTASGAVMAQPGSPNLIKRLLVGTLAGAGIGAAVGLIPAVTIPGLGWVVGGYGVPIGAAVGAAAGAVTGLISYVMSKRKQTLGLKAQQQATGITPSQGMPVLPKPVQGKVLRLGDSGADVKWTQRSMKKLGFYNGKITGKMDAGTTAAIKRYEMLKGAMPTGESSPDLRTALSVDMRVHRQFA